MSVVVKNFTEYEHARATVTISTPARKRVNTHAARHKSWHEEHGNWSLVGASIISVSSISKCGRVVVLLSCPF